MKRIYLALALCLLSAPALCRADSVDDFIREQMRKQHIPGLSLAVVKEGKVVKRRGYGLANLEHSVPARPETVYQLASVTKQFVAAGIMLLEQDGKLHLDDPIGRYVDGTPETWKGITIRNLLTHTSGIKDYLNELGAGTRQDTTPEKIVRMVADKPLNFAPGARWSYSNTGYVLLGMIIHRVSGKTYDAFLTERAFKPLGMLSTRRSSLDAVIPNRAAGYVWSQGRLRNAEYLNPTLWDNGDGGMLTTVDDLVKWDAALSGDQLLSAASREKMWTPVRLTSGDTYNYGFGWIPGTINGHKRVEHTGGRPGFGAAFARYPGDRVTVLLLTNGGGANPDGLAQGVARRYIPTLLPQRQWVKPDAKRLSACSGYYEVPGALATVTADRDGLSFFIDGHLIEEFRPVSDTRFAAENALRELEVRQAAGGTVTGMVVRLGTMEIPLTRVASIPHGASASATPTPATRNAEAFLRAVGTGEPLPASIPNVARGLQGPLSGGTSPVAGRITSLALLANEEVRSAAITRHGEKIARLVIFDTTVEDTSRRVFLYLTAEDLIADVDITEGGEG